MSDNNLKQIRDAATVLSLINTVKEESLEVYIWKFLGGTKLMGKVKIESLRKFKNDFCIVPVEGQDRMVMEMMSSQNHIDLYVPESALLLRCSIKHTDAPARYYLTIPEFVAQADRRKSLRLSSKDVGEIKLVFAKPMNGSQKPVVQHFMKTCYDVSTGGFSFLVSKGEFKFFDPKDAIPMVELKSKGLHAKLNVEVVTVREIEPDQHNGLTYKAWKISCRFTQIDQITKKYLEKYIFERIKEDLCAIN
jgi:hypothetical protein